jgi:hypothetical protein
MKKTKKLEKFEEFSKGIVMDLKKVTGGYAPPEPTFVWSQFQVATMEGSCSDSYSHGTTDTGCVVESCTVNC